MPTPTARGRLEVNVVSGQSAVTSAFATNPLKMLVPRSRGASVWAYLSSFGGGFVAGDQTHLDIRLGAGARCFLTTQAVTKVYRNPSRRPCGHELSALLEKNSLLALIPEPVQAFAGATYRQRQEFHLDPGAGLVLADWFCSGRAARGERWSFAHLRSQNEIYVDGERILLDSILLDATSAPLTLGRFNCVAVVMIIGEPLAPFAATVLAEIAEEPVSQCASLVVSASPVRHGALLRLAGERAEDVGQEIQRRLSFVPELLQDDPWLRKW